MTHLKLKHILYLFTATLLFSCESAILIDETSLDIPAGGLKKEISIDVGNDWKAYSTATWCTVSPDHGDKDVKTIVVVVARNSEYKPRNCVIKLVAGEQMQEIAIVQSQVDVIELSISAVELSDKAQDFRLVASSNVEYDVTVSEPWIHYIGTKVLENRGHSFYVDRNEDTFSRRAIITFAKQGGTTSMVTVVQSSKPYISPSANKLAFEWLSSTQELPVDTNVDFTAIVPSECDWLHVEKEHAEQVGQLLVSVDEFVPSPSTMGDRQGIITLVYNEEQQTIDVSQKFKDCIWISTTSVSMYEGEDKTVSALACVHDGINTDLSWHSDNLSVATVESGKICGHSAGTARIVVRNADASLSASVDVQVRNVADDIYVVANGKSLSQGTGGTSLIFQSKLHWPERVKSINFLSVWLCKPYGEAYDIKGTTDGYVEFAPVVFSGTLDQALMEYYSTWFVLYQVEVEGKYHEYTAYVDARSWGGGC